MLKEKSYIWSTPGTPKEPMSALSIRQRFKNTLSILSAEPLHIRHWTLSLLEGPDTSPNNKWFWERLRVKELNSSLKQTRWELPQFLLYQQQNTSFSFLTCQKSLPWQDFCTGTQISQLWGGILCVFTFLKMTRVRQFLLKCCLGTGSEAKNLHFQTKI